MDLHCVTGWSACATTWDAVSVDTLLDGVDSPLDTARAFVLVHGYDGYTASLPLTGLVGGRAWVAFGFDGADLPATTRARPGCWCPAGTRPSCCGWSAPPTGSGSTCAA